MHKAGLAGVVALAMISSSLVLAQETQARNAFRPAAHAGFVLTDAHIARLKAVLRLTPAQEKYWPPVEAALRDIVRHRREHAAGPPRLELASSEPAGPAVDNGKLRRAAAVALPLIVTLDEAQKRSALRLVRSLGLDSAGSIF